MLLSQIVGLSSAAIIAIARGESFPSPSDLAWAAAGGVSGGIGITALYHGLATGRVAVVAPIAGVLAATIPVVVGMAIQGMPGVARLAGIGLAVVAVVLVSRTPDAASDRPPGTRYGLLAGIGFGLFNTCASRFTEGIVFGPLVAVRLVEAVLVVAIVISARASWRVPRPIWRLAFLVGVGDMGGNAFFVLAAQAGRLDVAAVLSSLYPVTTIVLATVLLRERVTRSHAFGIAAAGLAIVLIAGG